MCATISQRSSRLTVSVIYCRNVIVRAAPCHPCSLLAFVGIAKKRRHSLFRKGFECKSVWLWTINGSLTIKPYDWSWEKQRRSSHVSFLYGRFLIAHSRSLTMSNAFSLTENKVLQGWPTWNYASPWFPWRKHDFSIWGLTVSSLIVFEFYHLSWIDAQINIFPEHYLYLKCILYI